MYPDTHVKTGLLMGKGNHLLSAINMQNEYV